MNTTIRFFHYLTVDAKAAGVYLNRMAEQGWAFDGSFCGVAWFRRTERTDLHYWAEPRMIREKRESADGFTHRQDAYHLLCADAGWALVEQNSTLQIFCSQPGTNPAPIQSDEALDYRRNWEQTLKSQQWNALFVGIFWLLNWGLRLAAKPNAPWWTLLLSPSLLAWAVIATLVLVGFLLYGVYLHARRRRMQRMLDRCGALPVPGPLGARLRGMGAPITTVLLGAILLSSLFYTAPNTNMLVTEEDWAALTALPVVRAEDVGLDGYGGGWWQDTGTPFLQKSACFQAGEPQSLYFSTTYSTSFPWLAEIVAASLLEQEAGRGSKQLHLHPPVSMAPIDLGFDQAWHGVDGEKEYLILRQGGVVVALEGPTDFTDPAVLAALRARVSLPA